MAITEYIQNVDRALLNTVFENTVRRVNKCLENGAGDALNITCNFLYCNHQVRRDFLITLYKDCTLHKASDRCFHYKQAEVLILCWYTVVCLYQKL